MDWSAVLTLGLAFIVGYLISVGRRMKKNNRKYKV